MRGLVALHTVTALALLTASPDPELAARVSAPQDSRAASGELRDLARGIHPAVLTNVAKYANASVATVDVRAGAERLEIRVSDDGVGGAAADAGLRGLADRLGALGGDVRVDSPPGAGTRLEATIPLEQPEPTAAEPGALRRRALQSHAVVYALVMALLVFIWLTTGGGYFWPQWSIVGWGLVLALHAWFARGRRPGMLGAETQPDR